MTKQKIAFNLSADTYHRYMFKNMQINYKYKAGDVLKWQTKTRKKLKELLKLPLKKNNKIKNWKLWEKKHKYGIIEKIVFRSEKYVDVPAYVCIPKNVKPPYTFFIALQGHASSMHISISIDKNEKTQIKVKDGLAFGIDAMKRGIAALCIEQRWFGERALEHHHGCHEPTMYSLMMGRTIIGERVFDIDRAIDYLYTRDDVKLNNIGILGNSGGGTTAIYTAALFPKRIKYIMPSCSFSTFKDSLLSVYHCVCNYIPGILKYMDLPDILGLFAPNPIVIVAGKYDHLFPIKGVKIAFKKLKQIYKAFNAEDKCVLVIGNGGHKFYADAGWSKMRSFLSV